MGRTLFPPTSDWMDADRRRLSEIRGDAAPAVGVKRASIAHPPEQPIVGSSMRDALESLSGGRGCERPEDMQSIETLIEV